MTSAPHWVHVLVEAVSDGGLVLLALLFVAVALRHWKASSSWIGPVVTAVSVVVACVVSEALKTLHAAPRPCWAESAARVVSDCPRAGDWSTRKVRAGPPLRTA